MIKYENECVGCPPEMGCMGSACPYRNVPVYYCDECGEEIGYEEDVYTTDGANHFCEDCYKKIIDYSEDEE